MINKDPEGEIVPLLLGVMNIYSVSMTSISAYNYYNTNHKYKDYYSEVEKNEASKQLASNLLSSPVALFTPDKNRRLLFEGIMASSDYVQQFSNMEPMPGFRSSPNLNSSKIESGISSDKLSINNRSSNNYKSTAIHLLKAQNALNKKDYNGASQALNKASKTLNKK